MDITHAFNLARFWRQLNKTSAKRKGKTATIILFKDPDHVLLIERGSDPDKGKLALPGGHVEPGEKILTAALRELNEETSIKLDAESLRLVMRYENDFVFAGILTDNQKPKAGSDAAAVKWADINNLPELAFIHNDYVQRATRLLRG